MPGQEEKLAEEDILRYLYEAGGAAPRAEVVKEAGGGAEAEEALRSLVRRGLVAGEDDRLRLTREGLVLAEEVARRHRIVEDAFRRLRGLDPHLVAHALEHLRLSPRFLARLASVKGRLRPLSGLQPGEEATIVAVVDPRPRILSRLYGVGVVPGRRVRVVAKSPGFIVVALGASGRTVAVDAAVASRVLVAVDA